MKIDIEVLKISVGIMLDMQKDIYGPTIEVDEDLYWFVDREELFIPEDVPKDLTLGSLEDDWKQIESVAKEEKDPFGYMLVWASILLRVVGEKGLESKGSL